jgi:hypothetical protein
MDDGSWKMRRRRSSPQTTDGADFSAVGEYVAMPGEVA